MFGRHFNPKQLPLHPSYTFIIFIKGHLMEITKKKTTSNITKLRSFCFGFRIGSKLYLWIFTAAHKVLIWIHFTVEYELKNNCLCFTELMSTYYLSLSFKNKDIIPLFGYCVVVMFTEMFTDITNPSSSRCSRHVQWTNKLITENITHWPSELNKQQQQTTSLQ